MPKKRHRLLTSQLCISLIFRLTRIYCRTFNLTVENEKAWLDYLEKGGTVLLCAWHQQFFSAVRYFQKYSIFKPVIMISQSSDGEIVAGVAQRSGWETIRGSSSKGGKAALKKMLGHLKTNRLAGHIVDGPQGPLGKVKPGAIRLAHLSNAVVVPFFVYAPKGWHFNSWDKFLLPKPFAKVTLHFGEMIKFDRTTDEETFEKQRKQLEEIMLPALIF